MKRWPLHKAYFWETAPFFRILAPFVAGILCYDATYRRPLPGLWSCIAILFCFLVCLLLSLFQLNKVFYRISFFLSLSLLLLLGGYTVSYYTDIRNDSAWFGNQVTGPRSFMARITDAPAEKERTWKISLSLLSGRENGETTVAKGKAFLYIYKDSLPIQLQKGDTIIVPGDWLPVKNSGNPFEFDYATYCRHNNICYQQFCPAEDVVTCGHNNPAHAPFIEKAHDWCMQQLALYITDPKTRGLIQAMLLGDEVNLDQDLLQSYSETGIVHIIAISGGNVGIFFMVISFLLRWLKHKRHLWISYAIALPLVWFYVLMAGAPPSAVRAALMFSLLAFAIMLQKNSNMLNQLFATAFLLLCIQPMWLFSVGFQLSFVAVLSLILFSGSINRLWSPKNKVAKWLWPTVVASMAAEILVAPLVVYYFHIFPLLFIVANVVAFFFMTLALIMSIAIVCFSFVPVVAKIIGLWTVVLVTNFDYIVTLFQRCNPASFRFLMLSTLELALIYVAITGIAAFVAREKKPGLFAGAIALCLLWLSFCQDEWVASCQHRLVVFNTGKASRIEQITGNHYSVLYTDTGRQKKTEYAVKPAHINWRAWRQDSCGEKEIIVIGSKTALVWNGETDTTARFHVDYLVVNHSGKMKAAQIQKIFSPSLIILGNNFSISQQERLKANFEKAGIAVHCVATDGAFVLN